MANKIYRFCEDGTTSDLLTDAEYLDDVQRTTGNQPGIARRKLVNKTLRNISALVATFAEYICQYTGGDLTDALDYATMKTWLDNLFTAKIGPATGCFRAIVPVSCVDSTPYSPSIYDGGKLFLVSQATSPYTAPCNITLPRVDQMIEGQILWFMGNRAGASYSIVFAVSAAPGSTKMILRNAEWSAYTLMSEASTLGFVAYPSANAWYVLPIDFNPAT